MSDDPDSPAPSADWATDVAREQLRLVRRQLQRQPLASGLTDVTLCWMAARLDLVGPALTWLALSGGLQYWRWRRLVTTARQPPRDPQEELRWLSTMVVALGVLRGVLAVVLFARPVQIEHYVFTLIYVGMMTAAVASVVGLVRPFASWCAAACGPLAIEWFVQGTWYGTLLGVLIVALSIVMIGHVRDHGRGLAQLVKLATDNERLAQWLRAARDASEAASMSKTRFFAAASHDLRQPLHALSINATTLEILARRESNPMIRELSQSINRALNQSNGLLDSLLDISNLDANAVRPRMRPVAIATLLAGVRDEFVPVAAQKNLALHLRVTDDTLRVMTDPDLLRRVLHNLVGNALKFSNAGEVTLGAQVAAQDGRDAEVRVYVQDTGPGIAESEQQRVFEEFYQIGNPSRDRSKGLGLGLPIVKRTAALLDAPLRLHSAVGVGTCVDLLLPRVAFGVAVAEEASPGEAPGAVVEAGALATLRVLVVDDEEEILHSLQALLAQLGCAVRCCTDGAGALEAIGAGFTPDVLLVDHRLRAETGIDVIARIVARIGPTPAVIVTGDTEPATIRQAGAAGHRVIHKPVQGAQLVQVLREATTLRAESVQA